MGALGPVKGECLPDRSRCRAVIDPQSQQSHGLVIPPEFSGSPWAVGNRNASTPTQVNTKKPKATIVRTITLLPRIGRTEPRVQKDRENQPHRQCAEDLGVSPSQGVPEWLMTLASGRHAQHHADQKAKRQQGKSQGDRPAVDPLGLFEAGQGQAQTGTAAWL